MSKETSLREADEALAKDPATKFHLTCNCGWSIKEGRSYIHRRIQRHFSYDGATEGEHVHVLPDFKT